MGWDSLDDIWLSEGLYCRIRLRVLETRGWHTARFEVVALLGISGTGGKICSRSSLGGITTARLKRSDVQVQGKETGLFLGLRAQRADLVSELTPENGPRSKKN
jgi:hypothetical protein